MKKKLCAPQSFPVRPELNGLPRAPHLIVETARLLRYRVRRQEPGDGVMGQHAARLLMAHLAVSGETNQLTLARQTHLSTPTVSVLLRKMENEGLVCRRQDGQDHRVVLVTLTAAGEQYDKERLLSITENDNRAMAGFSEEEKETLCRLLLRVQENIKEP